MSREPQGWSDPGPDPLAYDFAADEGRDRPRDRQVSETPDPWEPLIVDLMARFSSVSGFRQAIEDHRHRIEAALAARPSPAEPRAGDLRERIFETLMAIDASKHAADLADLLAAEDREPPDDGTISEGSLTPGGHVIGPKAWQLIVAINEYDDYLGTVLDVIDEAALKAETPEPTALDVDVLAKVLRALDPEDWPQYGYDKSAAAIAAAYATTVRSTTPPEPTR